jgi:hypothetical protein
VPLTRVTVTIPPDLVVEADELARRRGASRSAVVADALEAHVLASNQVERTNHVSEPPGSAYTLRLTNEALLAELGRRLGAGSMADPGFGPPVLDGPRVGFDRDRLAAVCRRHRIAKLSLFGSVLTDAFGPDSDVDVLVEFERGHTPGLGISDVEDDLSALFGGRPVDLVTLPSLHRLLRERVVESAVVQFAA